MLNLHKNPIVTAIFTAALGVVSALINQHVIPADYGTPILSAAGGIAAGYGVVVTSATSRKPTGAVVAPTSGATTTPTGIPPTQTVS